MSRHRPLRAALLFGLLFGASRNSASHVQAVSNVLAPPSSLEPSETLVAVRVTHRHRAVRECVGLKEPHLCTGREVDADTATSVRFERAGVTSAGLAPNRGAPRIVFPHHVGPQEQTIQLPAGEWLVDWPGATSIGHLQVAAGAHPQVNLMTSSGRCHFKAQRCELDNVRNRQLSVRDDVEP